MCTNVFNYNYSSLAIYSPRKEKIVCTLSFFSHHSSGVSRHHQFPSGMLFYFIVFSTWQFSSSSSSYLSAMFLLSPATEWPGFNQRCNSLSSCSSCSSSPGIFLPHFSKLVRSSLVNLIMHGKGENVVIIFLQCVRKSICSSHHLHTKSKIA